MSVVESKAADIAEDATKLAAWRPLADSILKAFVDNGKITPLVDAGACRFYVESTPIGTRDKDGNVVDDEGNVVDVDDLITQDKDDDDGDTVVYSITIPLDKLTIYSPRGSSGNTSTSTSKIKQYKDKDNGKWVTIEEIGEKANTYANACDYLTLAHKGKSAHRVLVNNGYPTRTVGRNK